LQIAPTFAAWPVLQDALLPVTVLAALGFSDAPKPARVGASRCAWGLGSRHGEVQLKRRVRKCERFAREHQECFTPRRPPAVLARSGLRQVQPVDQHRNSSGRITTLRAFPASGIESAPFPSRFAHTTTRCHPTPALSIASSWIGEQEQVSTQGSGPVGRAPVRTGLQPLRISTASTAM